MGPDPLADLEVVVPIVLDEQGVVAQSVGRKQNRDYPHDCDCGTNSGRCDSVGSELSNK
jgi:hypothetical protein